MVEGDDLSDPIADQSRSILDGHIVLSREMADFGIYPPINIQNSASRIMHDVTTKEHQKAAMYFKRLYSILKENEVLVRIGAYEKGNDLELDMALSKKPKISTFLQQNAEEISQFETTINELKQIVS